MIQIITQKNLKTLPNGKTEQEDLLRGVYDRTSDGKTTIDIDGRNVSARVYNKSKLDNFIFIRNEVENFYFLLKPNGSLTGRYKNKIYNSKNGVFALGTKIEEDENVQECPSGLPQ